MASGTAAITIAGTSQVSEAYSKSDDRADSSYATNTSTGKFTGLRSSEATGDKDESMIPHELVSPQIAEKKILYFPFQPAAEPSIDPAAEIIIRTHFAEKILSALKKIQPYCQTSDAVIYAEELLSTMRTMRDTSPFDLYLEVVMALYDALAFNNNWIEYNAAQYEDAYRILKNLASQRHLVRSKVEKAIIKLEDAGFDTTPFNVNFNLNED